MKILVLNGGGSRGLAAARFVQQYEQVMGPVGNHFDMICGVSTGAILGAMLASGMSATAAVGLYEELLPAVFPPRGWKLWRGILTEKYSAAPLEHALQSFFRDTKLGELGTKLMVLGTKISPVITPKVWKSWDGQDSDAQLWKIVRASTAAPTYFRPFQIGQEVYVDGGLCTNEPSMCALAEAVKLTGTTAGHSLLTIRPGVQTGYTQGEAHGQTSALDWIQDIVAVMSQCTERISEYQAHQLIGFNNHVVALGLESKIDASGEDFNDACVQRARQAWLVHEAGIRMQFG